MPPPAEISLATPADYPLLQQVRDTVFSEWGHVSRTAIADALTDRQDVLALRADAEQKTVGFCIGYRRSPGVFYVNYLAVLSNFRGSGLGREMMLRQENFARAQKYQHIEFNTFNHFSRMLRLGLSLNYRPIGVEQHEGTSGDLAIRFGKSLNQSPSNQSPSNGPSTRAPQPQLAGATLVPADDLKLIRINLDAGHRIVGMMRDPKEGRAILLMVPPP